MRYMTITQLHWSQKAAYGVVAFSFLTSPIYWFVSDDSHIAFGACFGSWVLFVTCIFLCLQTQPRELRPALLALLAACLHALLAGIAYS
jgi:hypothetical protein